MTDAIKNVASGDANIDALTATYKWAGASVTFGIPTDEAQYGDYEYGKTIKGEWVPADETVGFVAPTVLFAQAVRDAMAAVESFTALDLIEMVANPGDADIRAGVTTTPKPWMAGRAYAVGPKPEDDALAYLGGDAWFPTGRTETFGTYDYIIVAHELGHTLGLNDIIAGGTEMTADRQSTEFSIMTYSTYIGDTKDGWNHPYGNAPQSYMMYDIASLQFMYGADFTTNGGNTIYSFDSATGEMFVNGAGQGTPVENILFRTIWDGNGIDTYSFASYGANRDLVIDLAPGGWSDVDRDSTYQASDLNGGPNGGYARGQVFNALLYQGDERSLIENAIGGEGNDSILGNQADNALTGGKGNDSLRGLAGNDTLTQGSGGGILDGGADNDWIHAGSGADNIIGGTGADRVFYSGSNAGVVVNLAAGTGALGWAAGDIISGIEHVTGSESGDTITGNGETNSLLGKGGNDLLNGAGEDDIVSGEAGNDTLIGGSGGDFLVGGDGIDTVRYGTAVTLNLTTGIHTGEAAGDAFNQVERFEGSNAGDVITGDAGGNVFDGRDGDDDLNGMGGNDVLTGGRGLDTIDGGTGTDWVDYSLAGPDGVEVNLEAGIAIGPGIDGDALFNIENVAGSSGDDEVRGDAGANLLRGNDGNDSLIGEGGADSLYGGRGNDTVVGGAGKLVDGAQGQDVLKFFGAAVQVDLGTGIHGGGAAGATILGFERIEGTAAGDVLASGNRQVEFQGGDGHDSLFGGNGLQWLYGGAGDDDIKAGSGDDFLGGGFGDDVLSPGAGVDLIRYALGDGHDSVLGYDATEDFIALDAASFGATPDDPIADWVAVGAAPDASHGWLLIIGNTLAWDQDVAAPAAGPVTLMTFLRGAAPMDVGDVIWA